MINQSAQKKFYFFVFNLTTIALLFLGTTAFTQDNNISMATTDWEPYYSSTLKKGGVINELVSTAFNRRGYTTSIIWVPWIRALRSVESGRSDVVLGAYFTEERSRLYHISEPFFNIDVGIIALKEVNITSYSSLNDLRPYRIGINRGWAYTPAFDLAEYLNKDDATNHIITIRKLFARRVDMVAMSINIFKYEISKLENHTMSEVVVLDPLLGRNPLHIMMSLKTPEYVKKIDAFNSGMAEIKADGTYGRILSEHGF